MIRNSDTLAALEYNRTGPVEHRLTALVTALAAVTIDAVESFPGSVIGADDDDLQGALAAWEAAVARGDSVGDPGDDLDDWSFPGSPVSDDDLQGELAAWAASFRDDDSDDLDD